MTGFTNMTMKKKTSVNTVKSSEKITSKNSKRSTSAGVKSRSEIEQIEREIDLVNKNLNRSRRSGYHGYYGEKQRKYDEQSVEWVRQKQRIVDEWYRNKDLDE